MSHLETALELDPLLEQAVELLSGLYAELGEGSKAAELIGRYKRDIHITSAR